MKSMSENHTTNGPTNMKNRALRLPKSWEIMKNELWNGTWRQIVPQVPKGIILETVLEAIWCPKEPFLRPF